MTDTRSGVPQAGDLIAGKYRVEQVLGAGGMGVVVSARHLALRQVVAVKFLLPQAMRLQGASERFLREAQAAVAISSEHVARVLDVGTLESGAPYLVMEHLSGMDLGKVLKQRGPLPVAEAVDFVLQAGEAIAEAHTLGIVHRDLKPSNIFLTRRAEGSALVKVLDFGLSKMATGHDGSGDHSLTATDVVAGSPDYMSPEQVRSLKNVDGRTDLWALGVVLYELLTGKRPFHGPTPAAICASVAADRPLPVRALRADVPEGLDTAILRCLEKDPSLRFPNVGALALALAPFAPAASGPSIERIVRLCPVTAAANGWGDGAEAVTMPIAARASVVPATGASVHVVPETTGRSHGAQRVSSPAFVAAAVTGAVASAVPAPTLPDVPSTPPAGHTGGWGQTRPPSTKSSALAIGGAAAAAAVLAVGVVVWQVLAAGGATTDGPASSAATTTGRLPNGPQGGLSVIPGNPGVTANPATPGDVPIAPAEPTPSSASSASSSGVLASPASAGGAPSASATQALPAGSSTGPSGKTSTASAAGTAMTPSKSPAAPTVSPPGPSGASPAGKVQGASTPSKPPTGKQPTSKPPGTTVLDKPL